MTIDSKKYSRFLDNVAAEIDIPPSKYQDAVNRYQAVGRWLEEAEYPCSGNLSIYSQGSFRLGTVVKPIRSDVEAGYDIDLVCELPIEKHAIDPKKVKTLVGDRLREHGTYSRQLDREGKRCWTLEYAEQDGVGFHLDILPCVPDPRGLLDTSIAITNKRGHIYDWSASNPKGYGSWFDDKNKAALSTVLNEQKRAIQKQSPEFFAHIDDVPDQLLRTPLQRSIQLMKRHRDLRFNNDQNNRYAPISIIITTLAAQFYQNEPDTLSALSAIVKKLHAHAVLIENGAIDRTLLPKNLIIRMADGKWYIRNPINPEENFADRWHEDNHARARAFFSWITVLKEDLVDILNETQPDIIRKHLTMALGTILVSKHLDLTALVVPDKVDMPKIHIYGAAKPWGH